MIILVLNCGSSSLKYQVLDMKSDNEFSLLAKGLVERIGMEVGAIVHKVPGKENYKVERPIANHTEGVQSVLNILTDPDLGVLKSLSEIDAVGHRLVHGGETYSGSVLIDDLVIDNVKECSDLAPLHNPANLLGVYAVTELMPNTPQVGVFDTAFHQTMPSYAYMYAIPYEYYDKYKIRRYGFHGTSHRFVSKRACEITGMELDNSKIITCHLGNGSSITAIKNGKSIDTSMGFTPVEGLMMGTRSGSVDAGVITYIQEKEKLDATAINNILNKKSGMQGVSQLSSDNRDIQAGADAGNQKAILSQRMLSYSIIKHIGSYVAAMDGVDMIVFTGGIGENDYQTRARVANSLNYLGVDFNQEKNSQTIGNDAIITYPSSKVKIAVIATNEELVIAQDTMHIVNELKQSK